MVRRIVPIVVAAPALWFGYRWLFPGDEAQIRGVLARIADAVSSGEGQDGQVSRLARVAGVRNHLDPQISVDAGAPFNRMTGRDTIIGTIARVYSTTSGDRVVSNVVLIRTLDPIAPR
jgi:hypothetical protein